MSNWRWPLPTAPMSSTRAPWCTMPALLHFWRTPTFRNATARYDGRRLSGQAEIQLDRDTVGVDDEDLMQGQSRHFALAEIDLVGAEMRPHGVEIARHEGDVIERARPILVAAT